MKISVFFINLVLVCAVGRVVAQPALAEPSCFAPIDTLIKQGQSAEALARLDTCIAGDEDNPQGLLLKGRALFQERRVDEALAAFQRLAQMRPDSATAQNNLGVVHTKQGHLIDARTALEKAVALSPQFAIAHENLADVHVRLARLNYGLAAQAAGEKSSTRVLHKLARISEPKDLVGNKEEVVAKTLPATAAVAAPAATSVIPEPLKAKASPPVEGLEGAAAANAARAWAQAWSSGDFDAYLDFYDETFSPEGGKSRMSWEAERRRRVEGRHDIRVELSAIDVLALDPQSAEVRFSQVYTSGLHSDRGIKVLRFLRRGETWKIVKESFLPQSAQR